MCFVVGKYLCKMIPSSLLCFLCCMVLVVVWFGLHFRIHVCCLECAVGVLRFVLMYLVCS